MGFFLGCFGSTTKRIAASRDKTEEAIPTQISEEATQLTQGTVKRYKWEEIERYTMNFKEVIGVGGYSTVYLAKFCDKQLGAVKIYNSSERLNQVFRSELEISQKLHHANIVKLLGYCDDKDEGVLVFEYIPKGNLQEKLHNNDDQNNLKDQLTWKQRMKIAYILAKSLEYLHESCELQIVHGDIKASNILLNENFDPLLCDFGFAKMGFSSTIKPPSSSRIAMMGSPGYIDPHFLMTGIASKKSDVYSFGVILLELITGLEAFICERQVLLTSIVRNKDGFDIDKLVKMVDPRISRSERIDEEEIKIVGDIAARCLHHLPSLRLSATEICKMLQEKFCYEPEIILVKSEMS